MPSTDSHSQLARRALALANAVVFGVLAIIAAIILAFSMPQDMQHLGIVGLFEVLVLLLSGVYLMLRPMRRHSWIVFGVLSVMTVATVFLLHRHVKIAVPIAFAVGCCFSLGGCWMQIWQNQLRFLRFIAAATWLIICAYIGALPFVTYGVLIAISRNEVPAVASVIPVVLIAHAMIMGLGIRRFVRKTAS